MLKKIDHINIVVSDLEAAVEFFTDFGFIVEDDAELGGESISKVVGLKDVKARYVKLALPGRETKLELIKYYQPASERDAGISLANQMGFRHMAFEVEDIEAVVSRLKEKHARLVSSIQTYQKTGKRLIYFYGPDGIILELAEYPL